MYKIINKQFVCYLHFVGFNNINFGISLDWLSPNLEIHLPFCFLRIGWQGITLDATYLKSYGKVYKIKL